MLDNSNNNNININSSNTRRSFHTSYLEKDKSEPSSCQSIISQLIFRARNVN